jgi:hypothetical protein
MVYMAVLHLLVSSLYHSFKVGAREKTQTHTHTQGRVTYWLQDETGRQAT